MSKILRVLMIEDTEDDAFLVLRELGRGGYEPRYEICQDREHFYNALADPWDLILCDYILPSFDAMEALKIYRQSGLEIPFIVVSGNIGEDIAVSTMRAGAHDYIMKDNLARLVPAVERELRKATERTEQKKTEEELKLAKFATDHASDAIAWIDEQGIIFYANETASTLLNYPPGGLIGEKATKLGLQEQSLRGWEGFITILKQKGSITQEADVCTKDGKLLKLEVSANYLEYSGRKYICAFGRDITEKKQAEEAILLHSARVEALLRTAAHLNSMLELQTILNAVCEEAYMALNAVSVTVSFYDSDEDVLKRVTGIGTLVDYSREESTNIPHSVFEGIFKRPIHLISDIRKIPNLPHMSVLEQCGIKAAAFVSINYSGRFIGCLSVFFEGDRNFKPDEIMFLQGLTDQAALAITNACLFNEVKTGQDRMRKLNAQVVSAQEEERRRISRELHDEAGQALTALKIYLELIRAELPQTLLTVSQRIDEAAALAGATLEQIRMLAQDLRPPALDTIGINLTLEHYCREFSKRVQIPTYYHGAELSGGDDAQNVCLYRVLQEALTNIAKHACAKKVKVQLGLENAVAVLTIVDDGKGFAESEIRNGIGKGVGLLGMQERIEALNGTLLIESRLEQGTVLVARIPWGV